MTNITSFIALSRLALQKAIISQRHVLTRPYLFSLNSGRNSMMWDIIYWLKRTPWDTGITPPEVVDWVRRRYPVGGRAIDIGCGTGTNVVFLARHGFSVLGIDISRRAIALARRRAKQAGVACDLRVGDVSRLEQLPITDPFDLALDIGCFHVLSTDGRRRYAADLRAWMAP